MNDKALAEILSICLREMAAGKTMATCLARYPEQADSLAPMLAAVVELRALGSHSLSAPARLRAKARLRHAQGVRSSSVAGKARPALAWWPRLGSLPAARVLGGLAVTLCLLVLSAGIVAASQPGDLAYGLRVTAERVPAWLAKDPEARAQAELVVADRRLDDLQRSLKRAHGADGRAIAALLAGEEAAAQMAASLSPGVRAKIAAHITDQGLRLGQLSQVAPQEQTARALRAAAIRAYQAAESAQPAAIPPRETPVTPHLGRSESPTSDQEATPTQIPAPTVTATRASTDVRTPIATSVTAEPARSTPPAGQGSREPQMTATPGRTAMPGPKVAPAGTSMTPSAPTPDPAPTLAGPGGPAPTSPGPGPTSSAPGPGPGPSSPSPKHRTG